MEHTIITIGRQYGSGGRHVGRLVARKLGFSFYDRELITLTAQKSGFSEETVEDSPTPDGLSLFSNLYTPQFELPVSDQIYIAQFRVIWEIAQRESSVIVGRCADYALREHSRCCRVFVHAPVPHRIRRIQEYYGVEDQKPEALIRREDKRRALYYSHFTQRAWGACENYHLALNSEIGVEAVAEIIVHTVKGNFL